jgi:hypothetical protein
MKRSDYTAHLATSLSHISPQDVPPSLFPTKMHGHPPPPHPQESPSAVAAAWEALKAECSCVGVAAASTASASSSRRATGEGEGPGEAERLPQLASPKHGTSGGMRSSVSGRRYGSTLASVTRLSAAAGQGALHWLHQVGRRALVAPSTAISGALHWLHWGWGSEPHSQGRTPCTALLSPCSSQYK